MTSFKTYLTAGAVLGAVCAPAVAQNAYPYANQQQYQQPNAYGYPQQQYAYPQQAYPGYGSNQGYANQGTGNPVTDMIASLLGNRYSVTDQQAVRQCANAAVAQASQQYGGYGYNRRGMRVTSITEVQRRGNGLRVSGTMSSARAYGGQYGYQNGGGYGGYDRQDRDQDRSYDRQDRERDRSYDPQYGDQNRAYGGASVGFRCNVAYNGAVTGLRIRSY
jgi:hypothetical protein